MSGTTTTTRLETDVRQMVNDILRWLSVLDVAEDAKPWQVAQIVRHLAMEMDGWSTQDILLYNLREEVLTEDRFRGRCEFTIGEVPTADIKAPLPQQIESIILRQDGFNYGPMLSVDYKRWAELSEPRVRNNRPECYTYISNFPVGSLRFDSAFDHGDSLTIAYRHAIAVLGESSQVSMPPGYYKALYMNTAVHHTAPAYGVVVTPMMANSAAEAKRNISTSNTGRVSVKTNMGLPGSRSSRFGYWG